MDINPTLSWAENAQEAFRLAKKAKAREVFLAQQQTVLAHQLAYLDTLAVLLAQATTAATCAAIAQDLSTAGLAKPVEKPKPTKKGGKKPAKLPPKPAGLLALTASDGARLWVGQSGHANALLAGTLGAPSDWWLHVHQMPGSHVLLRCAYAEILPPKTLWEAANLAVYFSAARHSANVPVVYTRHRFVRKIPASYPGHVTYREEKTVFVSVDEALVRRLLAQPRRE
jgi:predicted ribosome quality control (RQC) complex YloA/Tae2 family protein